MKRFDISLIVLVPLIIGGAAALGSIVAFRSYPSSFQLAELDAQLLWIASGAFLFSALCSGVLLKLVLGPVKRFMSKARGMEVLQQPSVSSNNLSPSGDLEEIDYVFDQVTSVLDKLDAKALFPRIIGQSAEMRRVLGQVLKVAGTDSTVFIHGESGTGKELVARSIQEHSARSSKPFVIINCASVPEGLLESELFGHEKGAFTGAIANQRGKFELASGGTIFLDEIGDMPLQTQVKILRVLEAGECERVGGKSVKVDVRVIAATHRDIEEMVQNGSFREDLFHRLHVIPLNLPPLKNRREDIPALAYHFLEKFKSSASFTPEAMNMLVQYDYRGNVRELRNIIERAVVMSEGSSIQPEDLPNAIQAAYLKGANLPRTMTLSSEQSLDDLLTHYERQLIEEALRKSRGVQVKAASLLHIKERSLWHRVKKHSIDVKKFRE